MTKTQSKRLWFAVGAVELILLVISTIATIKNGNALNYILPVVFLYGVLLLTIFFSFIRLLAHFIAPAKTNKKKKEKEESFDRFVKVAITVAAVGFALHLLDRMIDL